MVPQSDIELINVLRSLVPISNLSKDNIELIAASSEIKSISKDYIVFNEGDNDEFAYYLLEGELELISTNNTNFHIISGTDDARYPLAQFQPRQYTAKAIDNSIVLILNRAMLDSLLVGSKADNAQYSEGVEVNEIENEETDDWMGRILQSPLYTRISVENIQKIFSKIESVDVRKNDVIINQGDSGDYYYIIQNGRCRISRKPTPTSQDIHLAELREGDAFGEEAIIANLKRNASVTMLSDGCLMRLKRKDFKELILNPILEQIDFKSAQENANKGAIWLDVRYPDEYQDYAIEGSLNIPLNMLRLQVNKLDSSRQYITCCDTASRSSIAAFVLSQHGFDVFHLNKGLKDLLRHQDANKIEPKTEAEDSSLANILPFKSNNISEDNTHLNAGIHDEISQLRKELDIVRSQLKEMKNVKDIASDLEKTVISATEKKLKVQRERINIQTQSANKLIQQAQKMQKDIENEKRLMHEEVDKHHQEQEKTMLHIQEDINKRLLEEEKKIQAFYSWKENEIAKIRELKMAAEKEYLAKKIENELKNNISNISEEFKKSNSIPENGQRENTQNDLIKNDLEEWLGEQAKNELTPLNQEILNAKRKLIEEANARAEKSRIISKVHDQTLSSEIDSLLKDG
jgi:CRP-like cAMP-binding protein